MAIIYKIWYLIEVFYYWLYQKLGFRLDTNNIPRGVYCYEPDLERNKNREDNVYYVKPCKYYRYVDGISVCLYESFIGSDVCLDDQCKICSENSDLDYDVDTE